MKSQISLTLALLGPSIHGSVILIGPSTSPLPPLLTLPELSDPDLVTLWCARIARFSRRVRAVGGEVGESTRVGGIVGGGRFTTGDLGDVGTNIGKGSAMWSGASMVGDGEARKRAPAGLGMNELDMVCWDFQLAHQPHFIRLRHSISISDKPHCRHSVKFYAFSARKFAPNPQFLRLSSEV